MSGDVSSLQQKYCTDLRIYNAQYLKPSYKADPQRFSTLEHAERCAPQHAFIVQQEYECKDDTVGRSFLVFQNIHHYIELIHKYNQCHEIIQDAGRIAFDFDIKEGLSARGIEQFSTDVEKMVKTVCETFMNDIDIKKIKFTWKSTKHAVKFSRHLIVRGLMAKDNRALCTKVFYLLCNYIICIKNMFPYIPLCRRYKIIDTGMSARAHMLRLPFNHKVGGNAASVLSWYGVGSYFDSLVRQYNMDDILTEQCISVGSFNISKMLSYYPEALKNELSDPLRPMRPDEQSFSVNKAKNHKPSSRDDCIRDALIALSFIEKEYNFDTMSREQAESVLQLLSRNVAGFDRVYSFREVNDRGIMSFQRLVPSVCVIDPNETHHKDGVFVTVSENKVRLHCSQRCTYNGHKSVLIGEI